MPSERFLRVGLMSGFHSTVSHRRIATAQRVRDLHYPNWSLHVADGHALGLEHLRQLRVDGVIAEGGCLKGPPEPGLPLVQYGSRHQPGFPWVDTDHTACGQLAAATLRAMRRASYAHVTWPVPLDIWRQREHGFIAGCGTDAPAVHTYGSLKELGLFLLGLRLPAAVFCANDVLGQWTIDACHEHGLLVPDEVAVMGVDDDPVLCPLATPPLTSIAQDDDGMMTALFDQLDRLESGRPCQPKTVIAPLRVVHRRSTGLDGRQDLAQQAMALIRTFQETTVAGLALRMGVTQRSVQRALLAAYGMSPLTAIRSARIARAKRLLAAGHAIAEVAATVGYASLSAFHETFRDVCGETPGTWLEKQRG